MNTNLKGVFFGIQEFSKQVQEMKLETHQLYVLKVFMEVRFIIF